MDHARAGRYVVMGVAGSGKSVVGAAFARALGIPFLDADDLHPAENVARMRAGIPLTDADRAGWLDAIAGRLATAARDGRGLVVACSALKRAYRDRLRAAAPDLRVVHLRGERALIAARLAARRGHFIPAALLDSQLATLEEPAPDEAAWPVDVARAPAAIVEELMRRVAPA